MAPPGGRTGPQEVAPRQMCRSNSDPVPRFCFISNGRTAKVPIVHEHKMRKLGLWSFSNEAWMLNHLSELNKLV